MIGLADIWPINHKYSTSFMHVGTAGPRAPRSARPSMDKVAEWITAHVPDNVEPQHREKFISDVLAELENLDASRIGGLGITREELEAWQELRHQR